MTSFTEISDVVDKVRNDVSNVIPFYDHHMAGTIELYYAEMITQVITDFTNIPVERGILGIEEVDDPDAVIQAWTNIAVMLADGFDKNPQDVEADMISLMNKFPVDDVRQSTLLQRTTGLH